MKKEISPFKKVGFTSWQIECLHELCKCKSGIIIICGKENIWRAETALSIFSEVRFVQGENILVFDEIYNFRMLKYVKKLAQKGYLIVVILKSNNEEDALAKIKSLDNDLAQWSTLIKAIIHQQKVRTQNGTHILIDVALKSKNSILEKNDIRTFCDSLEHHSNIASEILFSLKKLTSENCPKQKLELSSCHTNHLEEIKCSA